MNNKHLPVITGLFVAVLLISNILDTKVFSWLGLNLPAGIILFPMGYVFGDILTEVYGYKASRKVIWTGACSLALLVFSLEIARRLPAAAFWTNQSAFNTILGHVPRLVLASILAFLCGEFCNSYIVAKMKIASHGKRVGVRLLTSTVFGQLVDTSVFVLVAFLGVFPSKELVSIILSAWAFKVVWELLALPITISIVQWLKNQEQIDVYDNDTNFNPFSLS